MTFEDFAAVAPSYTEIRVQRTEIIGTKLTVFSAWAPNGLGETGPNGGFSTFTYDDDGRNWGRIGTDRLPAAIDAIPAGPERSRVVHAFHADRYGVAYRAILDAFPLLTNARGSRSDMGEIEAWEAPASDALRYPVKP